ncbi:MAG: PKD domain-containing protein [Thermoplasmata archaeon]|nr:PKD domain-containing protein [Thermoplasmata archaeon]
MNSHRTWWAAVAVLAILLITPIPFHAYPAGPRGVSPLEVKVPSASHLQVTLHGSGGPASCNVTLPMRVGLTLVPFNSSVGFGSGPIPLNVTAIPDLLGGVPPYVEVWNFGDGSPSIQATGPVHHTYTYAGVFEVSLQAQDSGGNSYGIGSEIQAWGSAGPDPINITANQSLGFVPLSVSYHASVTGAPAGATYSWLGAPLPKSLGNGTTFNQTYRQPGTFYPYLMVYYPNGTIFAIGSSPEVEVNPLLNLSVAASSTTGVSPFNVTFWGNVTTIPGANYSGPYQIDWNFMDLPSNGTPTNATTGAVVHHTFSAFFAELPVQAQVVAPSGVVLAAGYVEITIDWNGSGGLPFPVVSLSVSPSNGSAPLQVNGSTYAFGGVSPYRLSVYALGPLTTTGYGPCVPVDQVSSWNGSALAWSYVFNQSGNFLIFEQISDSSNTTGLWSTVSAAVSVPTGAPAPPLSVQVSHSVTNGSGNATATFSATVSGGVPPYSVQWRFGDGSFGSSRPGDTIDHLYGYVGSYTPTLTVTDSRGARVSSTLPTILVAATTTGVTPGQSGPHYLVGPNSPLLLGVVLASAACTAAVMVAARRARRREGLLWVETMETECGKGEVGPRLP